MTKYILTALKLISFTLLNAQSTSDKLTITPLVGDFYIYTTYHDYKGAQVSANGLYLVTDKGVLMIDTPWDTTQFQPLLDSIRVKHRKEVVLCIATHSHEDRSAGLEYYSRLGIRTYTTKQTDNISKERGEKRAEFLIESDTTFQLGGYSFQTYYGGAGHAPDNIVIWFEKEKILHGGCLIKSTEAKDLGYLGDADIQQWKKTLENVLNKFGKPHYVIPGHQDWKDANSIEHTLRLLKKHK